MEKVLMVLLVCITVFMLVLLPASGMNVESRGGASVSVTGDSVAGNQVNGDIMSVIASGTIQAAVDASPDRASAKVLLEPKTYTENVDIDKSLQLIGKGIGTTIVDGGFNGPVFTIEPTKTVTLSGILITHGQANSGGGIYNYGTLNLDNILITGNKAIEDNFGVYGGGGIMNDGGTVNMNKGSSIAYNTAYYGAGVYNNNLGTVNMNAGSSITNNEAIPGSSLSYTGAGGGIYSEGTVNMNKGSSIANNKANYGGGIFNGLHCVNMYSGSSITGNKANVGGGIYIMDTVNFIVKGKTIATYPPPGGYDTTTDPYGFFTPHNIRIYDNTIQDIADSW